ncbi:MULTISPECIES: DUF4062 domain-containing protein [unclassified Acinetobacter]|uniref:DUF4062 domain-containing protein n=1 Tax=unclassified Acinetobacter TaxID=196816 RepID=UPI001C22B0D0|nr:MULTISPECIES: DUF4062 domain-containing protein [unclassified Acinetobacter]
MAKPRIFVSSTYYDLKHIRASLSLFIDSLGYESILFEKGQIAFIGDDPLDISCYREAESADIFVLIIGGRYGSIISNEPKIKESTQYTDYNSITKKEYETAHNNHIPTYILVEKGVYAEYQTFKNNRNNDSIKYAHVDNINIFKLIDDIHNKPNNNPIFSFEKYNEIEEWLKEQWSGLFKDFLVKRGNSKKFESLQSQIRHLETLNLTLKNYLEVLINADNKLSKNDIIKAENEKITRAHFIEQLHQLFIFSYLFNGESLNYKQLDTLINLITISDSPKEFIKRLIQSGLPIHDQIYNLALNHVDNKNYSLLNDLNELRSLLSLSLWSYD